MSALLTWSSDHGYSQPSSDYGSSTQGTIKQLRAYFDTLSAFSDFPWVVASYEETTSPWYVVLKPKSGGPGRLIVVGVSVAPQSTFNPQFGNNFTWTAAGARAAFFPAATSDVPNNILSLSGDVFTNPTPASGFGSVFTFSVPTYVAKCFACEEGIVFTYGAANNSAPQWMVGNFLEDAAGDTIPAAISCSSTLSAGFGVPSTSPSNTSLGAFTLDASQSTVFWGAGPTLSATIVGSLRDLTNHKAFFTPATLASIHTTMLPENVMKYKLRQIAYGPTPLAPYESLSDASGLQAISLQGGITTGYPWLVNFKV